MATNTERDFPQSMTMAFGREDQEKAIAKPDAKLYRGKWRNKKDGHLYKHCIHPHALGKTHKAIVEPVYKEIMNEHGVKESILVHTGLFWEGTEEEFDATFRRE